MKALIVAAGQGLRLRGVAVSKPLAPVLGLSLIERVIDSGVEAGIEGFVVVTGYEAARLTHRMEQVSARTGVAIDCVHNEAWRGANGVSVLTAQPHLQGRFVLMMADHLFDPAVLRDLMAAAPAGDTVVLGVDRRLDNPLVDLDDVTRVETGPGGEIRRIGKLIETYDAFDTGLFLAGPALFEGIEADLTAGGAGGISGGMQWLADSGRASTFDIGDRFWIDVDDEVALRHAEREQALRAGTRAAS